MPGNNGAGQLGDGTTNNRTSPVEVVIKQAPATSTVTATATATSTGTATPTKPPSPGDTDSDGCDDQQENGTDERLGGQRDFNNVWDFFDTALGSSPSATGA